MNEVERWLESLKLKQYFQAFQTRGLTTLYKCSLLSEADLDSLGVTLPGHRKRILSRLPKHTSLTHPTPTRRVPPKKAPRRYLSHPNVSAVNMATNSPPPPSPCQPSKQPVYTNSNDDEELYQVPPSPVPVPAEEEEAEESIYMNFDAVQTKKPPKDDEPPPLPSKTKKSSQGADLGGVAPPGSPSPKPVPAPRKPTKKPIPKPRVTVNKNKPKENNTAAEQLNNNATPLTKQPSLTLDGVTQEESSDFESEATSVKQTSETDVPTAPPPVPPHATVNNNNNECPKYEPIGPGTGVGVGQPSGARPGNIYQLEPVVANPALPGGGPDPPPPASHEIPDQNMYEEYDICSPPSALDAPIPVGIARQLEPAAPPSIPTPVLAAPQPVEENLYEEALDVDRSSRLSSASSVMTSSVTSAARPDLQSFISEVDPLSFTNSNDSLNQLVLPPSEDSPNRSRSPLQVLGEGQNLYTEEPTSQGSTPRSPGTSRGSTPRQDVPPLPPAPQPPAGTTTPARSTPSVSDMHEEEIDNQSNEFLEERSKPGSKPGSTSSDTLSVSGSTTPGVSTTGGSGQESCAYEAVWNFGEKQLIKWDEEEEAGDQVPELRLTPGSSPGAGKGGGRDSRVSVHLPPPAYAPPPLPGSRPGDTPPAIPPRPKPKPVDLSSSPQQPQTVTSATSSRENSRFSQIDPFDSFQRSFSNDDPFQKPDPFVSDDSFASPNPDSSFGRPAESSKPRDTLADFDAFSSQRLQNQENLTSTPHYDKYQQEAACHAADDSCGAGASCDAGKPSKPGRLSEENVYSPYPMPSPTSPASPSALYSKPHRSAPKPPPKSENLAAEIVSTYMLENDFSNMSFEQKASVWESDDTLSDGGDFLESRDMGRRYTHLQKQSSIPVVPTVTNKVTTRTGHMFKYASKRSSRYMGSQWIKRWVIFENGEFRYYSTNKSKVSKRVIPLVTMLHVQQEIKSGENHPYRFTIITIDRRYTFALDDADDLTMWTSILMQAIIEMEPTVTSFPDGGEMHMPDKEGFVRMEGIRGKRYLAIKKDLFCYYNTYNDYKVGSPIHKIEMKLASAKYLNKGNKLQLNTPYASYTFIFDSPEELQIWKNAFEESIAEGLGDDQILHQVYENSCNMSCADCGAPDPHWASINFFITLCKQCAGIHRTLSVPRSKVRSLRMDFKVWTPPILDLMLAIGNDNSNHFWEWNATEDDKIDSDSDMPCRKEYILNKYEKKKYCRFHPLHTDETALNEALCKQAMYDDVLETMHLVFSGADVMYVSSQYSSDNETAIKIARRAKQPFQVEFLYQNGAEGSGNLSGRSFREPPSVDVSRSRVIMKGYLHKTGSNPKGDFLRRWVVLVDGKLNYYENEKSSVPKDTIERKEILSLTKTTDDRFEFAFEVGTLKYGGRVYLFAADTQEDRTKWVNSLAKIVAPVTSDSQDKIKDMDKGGVIFLRDGATNTWKASWIQLKHKTLSLYDEDAHAFEELDLRKAKSITQLHDTERCIEAFDEGQPFVLDFPSRALYMQGDTRRETETWFSTLHAAVTQSSGHLEDKQLTQDDIPLAVEKCISFVAEHGIQSEGIYRLNGQHSKVTTLLEQLNSDARTIHLNPMEYNINDVATALKRFFRSLDDPLLTTNLYEKWINTATLQEVEPKLQWYKYLLGELPKVNYNTLKKLVFHLSRVVEHEDKNKMGIINLASIFGPVSLKVDKDGQSDSGFGTTNQEIAVLKDLLENDRTLFEFKEEEDSERKKEKKLEEARKKWEILQKKVNTSCDMQLYFHVETGGAGAPVEYPCKVSPDMLAEDVLDYLQKAAKLPSSTKWGLFEQICDDELVRPIHHREKIFDITTRWGRWTSDTIKKNAKMVVMKNYMYETMETIHEPTMSLFSELRYTEEKKKRFKRVYFQFGQYKLSYQNDTKASQPVASWNAEDLLVFKGVQSIRKPPTQFGFSFVKMSDIPSGQYFGHAVCCNNEEELYRWVAGILHAQHPGGLEPGSGAASGQSPQMPSRHPPPPPGHNDVQIPENRLTRSGSNKRSIIQRIFKK